MPRLRQKWIRSLLGSVGVCVARCFPGSFVRWCGLLCLLMVLSLSISVCRLLGRGREERGERREERVENIGDRPAPLA